jgi:hypothetical protein
MLKLFDIKYELEDEVFDKQEGCPVTSYEEIVSTWVEQLRSAISVDELKELEEIS